MAALDVKSPVGSLMRTAEWAAQPQEVRDRSFFSAAVTETQWLAHARQRILDLARNRETDRGKIRLELMALGRDLGMDQVVDPIDKGTLRDPLSFVRMNLIINTQLDMAHGCAAWMAGQDPALLTAAPCQELYRAAARRAPRDWVQRWVAAGGRLYEGRMIARKDDDIWIKINRFGHPWPPFDYASGMSVRRVGYREAKRLRITDDDTAAEAQAAREGGVNPPDPDGRPGLLDKGPVRPVQRSYNEGARQSLPVPLRAPEKEALRDWSKGTAAEDEEGVVMQPPGPWGRRGPDMPGKTAPRNKDGVPLLKKTVKQPRTGRSLKEEPDLPTPEEAESINFAVERGILLAADGKEVVRVVGERGKLTFDLPDLERARGGRLLHNHPNGNSVSFEDLEKLMLYGFKDVRAIGHHGLSRRHLYRISAARPADFSEISHIKLRYEAIGAEHLAELEAQIAAGGLSRAEADRNFAHNLMLRLTEEFPWLSYKRIKLS